MTGFIVKRARSISTWICVYHTIQANSSIRSTHYVQFQRGSAYTGKQLYQINPTTSSSVQLSSISTWICVYRQTALSDQPILLTYGFSGGGARMPARSVCLVTLSLSEAGPGRFGRQVSVTDIYHTIPYQPHYVQFSSIKLSSISILTTLPICSAICMRNHRIIIGNVAGG